MARSSSLRHLKRIANKSRLKIYRGDLDGDEVPYEEDPTTIHTWSTSGVDSEDANEHHLQAVLSAAHLRNQAGSVRSTRGAADKGNNVPAAYIPTPDSNGIVENYEELYAPQRWTDPATYIRSSDTVEESTSFALANGFIYYMDERDKVWLDKNNEEARGEGTSAQGAVSGSGTNARSSISSRSAKSKGKEPDLANALAITEDEFELVMAVFEKVTHEKTEYLHHGLETGMAFPAFADYQETFSSPLVPPMFAAFSVPTWIPPPAQLLRIARVIYPHWKERRLERGGHRIIPILNGDEADTLNESYICFRRREIKAVRKTRASQAPPSDKLVRLNTELAITLELAKSLITRETVKKEMYQQSENVWDKRLAVVKLKSQFPTLGDKGDEELLYDKERPSKKAEPSRLPNLRLRGQDMGSPSIAEVAVRPRERAAMIQSQIERELLRQKDRDHHWDDQVENLYQPSPTPFPSRLFKYIPPASSPSWPYSDAGSSDEESPVEHRAVRLRLGRGGRLLVDRRHAFSRPLALKSARRRVLSGSSDEMDTDDNVDGENLAGLTERWRFDADDGPAVGPNGPDEQDRMLVDDYAPKYLLHTMTLLSDIDQQSVMNDPTITVSSADGRQQTIVPFRLGIQQPMMRRDTQGMARPYPSPMVPQPPQSQITNTPGPSTPAAGLPANITPVAGQQQKKLPAMPPPILPPSAVPQMRISGMGIRQQPMPIASMGSGVPTSQTSPPIAQSHGNGMNGVNRGAINMPHLDAVKSETPAGNGNIGQMQAQAQADGNADAGQGAAVAQKLPNQGMHHLIPANGYHIAAMNGFPGMPVGANYPQHGASQLTAAQMQGLKSAFANMPSDTGAAARATPYVHVVSGNGFAGAPGMNLKLPVARQMQWAPRPNGTNGANVVNGANGAMEGANGHAAQGGPSPGRTPGRVGHAVSMSPHVQHSPSPPRPPLTPTMMMSSPSLAQQQSVGGTQGGY